MDDECLVCGHDGDMNELAPRVSQDEVIFRFECCNCHSILGEIYSLTFKRKKIIHKGSEALSDYRERQE